MTTIQLENISRNRIALMGLVVLAIVLTLMIVISIQTSPAKANISQTNNEAVASAGDLAALTPLSASQALAANEPALFVFTPVEQCTVQYCLTAGAVQMQLATRRIDGVNVVEVPVHSYYIYTDGTPPDYLFAKWDLYPTEPYYDWMPEATLTQFGWGLSETKVVLVDEEAQLIHDFAGSLDWDVLKKILD